jgi:hypothetical protein
MPAKPQGGLKRRATGKISACWRAAGSGDPARGAPGTAAEKGGSADYRKQNLNMSLGQIVFAKRGHGLEARATGVAGPAPDIRTTLRYAHLAQDHKRQAIGKLGKMLTNMLTKPTEEEKGLRLVTATP